MIGERIKKLRQNKGYSITEMAELAGVSKSYLSYIERNLQNNPSLQFLSKLAAPLDTSIEYLLGNEETRTEASIEEFLDEEWREMIENAINEGMSKEDFQHFRDYIRFFRMGKNTGKTNENNKDNT
ncbi:helix-turn-helix domain-containing protein [Bacillus sp. FJAT-47783]|uniref:helix-turn-helix domain-containing protein n=1 Tax=Bacillus sp. FJAT-47783 TaxID=2922712 RepID=UPI001FABE4F9|nr:helix-turn-helix domain-containing protein [Bacillus sp. FJAT-47783]